MPETTLPLPLSRTTRRRRYSLHAVSVAIMCLDAGLDDATATRLALDLASGDHPSTLTYLDADLVAKIVERLVA